MQLQTEATLKFQLKSTDKKHSERSAFFNAECKMQSAELRMTVIIGKTLPAPSGFLFVRGLRDNYRKGFIPPCRVRPMWRTFAEEIDTAGTRLAVSAD